MRKFLFTVFIFLITFDAWSLTITCQNRGDYTCTVDTQLTPPQNCNAIANTDTNKNYLYLTEKELNQCTRQIAQFWAKTKCPAVQRASLGTSQYLLYCITNEDIKVVYTNEETESWSYAQKRCVGSWGTWTAEGKCDCSSLTGTKAVDNECLCVDNPKQKYYNKMLSGCATLQDGVTYAETNTQIFGFDFNLSNWDRLQSCSPSGGTWSGKVNNNCKCDTNILKMELDKTGYFCNCLPDHDYRDPLAKTDGCKPISEIPDYNIAQDTHETNPSGPEASQPNPGTTEPTDESAPEASQPNPATTEPTDETDSDDKQELTEEEIKALAGKLKDAKNVLADVKETEQSFENRMLGGASMAATGLGAMQAASGYAEQKADAEAEQQMRAYLATMKCEYGGGQNVVAGAEEVTLPGGNELLEYYTEYKSLADSLKQTKTALGLRSGIESEILYDRAQSGLYQYASTGKTGGAYTSLSRALTDSDGADATAWSEQKTGSDKKQKVGAGVAAGGAVTGVAGNALINTDMIQNIQNALKDQD